MGKTKLDNFFYNFEIFVKDTPIQIPDTMHSSTQVHREALQRQTQQDWANREYIELIAGSIKRIADFLNSFDMSCRSRLSNLNEKLTTLERKVDFLEAKVSRGGETPT